MSTSLIVNADDFGFFDGISAGILEGIEAGVISATGVMANAPAFDRWAAELARFPQADPGVHLNATFGAPLSDRLRAALARQGHEELPNKSGLTLALALGRLTGGDIKAEWRAQIQRCLRAGLQIRFLNSHEHVHMLPQLYPSIVRLAEEFHLPFVRYTHAELDRSAGSRGLVRWSLVRVLNALNSPQPGSPELLGLAPSGHLDMQYIERKLPQLKRGRAYELMCHPGRDDAAATANPDLRSYHDWTGELECLLSSEFREALARHAVRVTRFRDLQPNHGQVMQ